MEKQIGVKDKIAFIIGKKTSPDLRKIDIYIKNELVTYFDNTVYVPQFIHSVESEASALEAESIDNEYIFLNWGPTTDDIIAHGILEDANLQLKCELGTGKKIKINIPVKDVISIYRSTVNALRELHA